MTKIKVVWLRMESRANDVLATSQMQQLRSAAVKRASVDVASGESLSGAVSDGDKACRSSTS